MKNTALEALGKRARPDEEQKLQPRLSKNAKAETSLLKRSLKHEGIVRGDLKAAVHLRLYRHETHPRIASRVLTEEDYVSILEHLIERDFFPDLARLRLQTQLVGAQREGSTQDVLRCRQQLEELDQRTAFNGTSRRVKLVDGREFNVDLSRLTLEAFQSLFTSEDNACFEKLVAMEKEKLASEQGWMERAALTHNVENAQRLSALQAGDRPAQLIYGSVEARNPLMFPLTEANAGVMALTSGASEEGSTAALAQQLLKHNTQDAKHSSDIYAICLGSTAVSQPQRQGTVEPTNTRLQGEDALLKTLTEEQVAKQRHIELSNERQVLLDAMVAQGIYSASALADARCLDSLNRRGSGRYTAFDLGFFPSASSFSGKAVPLTPSEHKGFSFLRTPLLEHGTSTPVGTASRTTPHFQIPELSDKERVAHRLSDRSGAARKRASAQRERASGVRDVLRAAATTVNTTITPGSSAGAYNDQKQLNGVALLRHYSATRRTAQTPLGLMHSSYLANALSRKATCSSSTKPSTPALKKPRSSAGVPSSQKPPTANTDNLLQF